MKLKKKHDVVEIHKYTVIEPLEEIYPETGRKLIRPNVNIKRAILIVILYIVGIGIVDFALNMMTSHLSCFDWVQMSFGTRCVLGYILLLVVCLIVRMKKIVIFIIRVYQRYGPYEIRCMCLFVPNCSEYMILAIEKYGLIKGLKKGIHRFHRCHAPNGGEDYP